MRTAELRVPRVAMRQAEGPAPRDLPEQDEAVWLGGDVLLAPDEVRRARQQHGRLAGAEHAAFGQLLGGAPSRIHRLYLWKALAAAHTLKELERFSRQIAPICAEELPERLRLRRLIQQHGMSCEVTSAERLLSERDPIDAFERRAANPDVGAVDNSDPYAANWRFGNEQRVTLEAYGGAPGSRAFGDGRGIPPERSTDFWNSFSDRTGLWYGPRQPAPSFGTAAAEAIAEQLARHIPTPLNVTGEGGSHSTLALKVEGTGNERVFTLHEPWSGGEKTVTWMELVTGRMPLGPWARLQGYRLAEPLDAAPLHPTELPAALRELSPPPPPKLTVTTQRGGVHILKAVRIEDAEGRFRCWAYPKEDYNWQGLPIIGTRRYEDVDGTRLTVRAERTGQRTRLVLDGPEGVA